MRFFCVISQYLLKLPSQCPFLFGVSFFLATRSWQSTTRRIRRFGSQRCMVSSICCDCWVPDHTLVLFGIAGLGFSQPCACICMCLSADAVKLPDEMRRTDSGLKLHRSHRSKIMMSINALIKYVQQTTVSSLHSYRAVLHAVLDLLLSVPTHCHVTMQTCGHSSAKPRQVIYHPRGRLRCPIREHAGYRRK